MALAAMLAVLLPGVPAWAHNALTDASPAKNATLAEAPSSVKLKFLQKLDPDYTVISVTDAGKQKVPTSEPKIDGATGSVTFDEPLTNGVYTVAYQVVSTDGHTVKGSYTFTLDDPSAAEPSPVVSVTPQSDAYSSQLTIDGTPTQLPPVEAAPASDSGGSSTLAWVAGVLILIFAGLAGFVFIRRRKA
ncbi:copper resistance protein CopC [Actinoplanes sp. NPDC023936]|uniref:copper resistance protein CopC n=1 Tax=Actinoplanes sp. NPDC023936 TaxID=3154910 RepID=UPI0033C930DE